MTVLGSLAFQLGQASKIRGNDRLHSISRRSERPLALKMQCQVPRTHCVDRFQLAPRSLPATHADDRETTDEPALTEDSD